MPDARTYTGGCHCGAVRYQVTTDLATVMECNCSICSKTGTLLTFVGADQFRLETGDAPLSDYQFAAKHIHHLFCPTCGIRSFARGAGPDGKDMFAVNVRCLEDVEPADLNITHYDGRAL